MIMYCPRCGTPFGEKLKGEWFETPLACPDCGLAVAAPPAMLSSANDEAEVQYDLAEWAVAERASATDALVAVDIPYRWEPALVLTVPSVAEAEVDLLLDELGTEDTGEDAEDDAGGDPQDPDDDSEEGVGGIAAQEAMADLFVAADRLQHDPAAPGPIADALEAILTIIDCRPPYGIERPVWRQLQGMADTLAGGLEESVDEDSVAAEREGAA